MLLYTVSDAMKTVHTCHALHHSYSVYIRSMLIEVEQHGIVSQLNTMYNVGVNMMYN